MDIAPKAQIKQNNLHGVCNCSIVAEETKLFTKALDTANQEIIFPPQHDKEMSPNRSPQKPCA